MGARSGITTTAVLSLTLALGAGSAVPADDYRARTEQRHEVGVEEGPVGAGAGVVIGNEDGGIEDLTVRNELRLRGLPQPPDGAAAPQPPAPPDDDEALTLPNLAPLPPYDIFIGPAEHPQGPVWSNLGTLGAGEPPAKHALRFTTTIQNRGRYGFELVGTPWAPDPDHPDVTTTQAYQCVRFTGLYVLGTQRNCTRYSPVGTLTWHAQHRHFHINGFGRYELRRDVNGRPDLSKAGLIGASQKVGWCTSDMYNWREDHAAEDDMVGAAQDEFMLPYERSWYQECTNAVLYTGASWRQGISPGWADTYPAMYTGQEIPLKGVRDGVYWIVTTINPKDNEFGLTIQETTWADNMSASRVQVYAGGTKAKLLTPMPGKPYDEWYDNPEEQPGH